MDMKLEFTGTLELAKTLQGLGQAAPQAVGEALFDEGNELLNDSKEYVPVDFGTLRNSGHVEPPKQVGHDIQVMVGYGGAAAAYALAVHENPRSGKTGGVSPSGKKYQHWATTGQWKYLETPFKIRVAGYSSRMANRLKQSLFTSRFGPKGLR